MNKAHLHHHTLLYSLNTVTCSLSLCTKRLWRMSWQHTFIWNWERWSSQLNTSWLRTRDIMNGERLGNVIVYLSLSIAALVRHLSKSTFLRPSRQLMDDDENGWILSARSDLPTARRFTHGQEMNPLITSLLLSIIFYLWIVLFLAKSNDEAICAYIHIFFGASTSRLKLVILLHIHMLILRASRLIVKGCTTRRWAPNHMWHVFINAAATRASVRTVESIRLCFRPDWMVRVGWYRSPTRLYDGGISQWSRWCQGSLSLCAWSPDLWLSC